MVAVLWLGYVLTIPVDLPSQCLILSWNGEFVCGHLLCSNETLDIKTVISCDHDLPFAYDLFRVTEFGTMCVRVYT